MGEYIWSVAKKFFVTSGKASGETPKGTMQEALTKAKIQQCNLVPVSSVLDADAEQIEIPQIPHAAIAYCVMAEQTDSKNKTIAAGIGWAYMKNKDGSIKKAYVVEHHGTEEERAIKETLMLSLVEMAEAEHLNIYSKRDQNNIILNRKEWLNEELKQGKHFDNWKPPERSYLRYLDEKKEMFNLRVEGFDKVPEDYGYTIAALVYVFER